jgi:hypothetical protein
MQPNSKLRPLGALIGEWTTLGTHPMLPGRTLVGRATFAWLEEGAFVIMRTDSDEPEIPPGIAILGTDDSLDVGAMIYFDSRGVSREYRWSMAGKVWQWWRNDPEFSQRFVVTVSDDGQRMLSTGEMSRDGADWEPDLQLTYTRQA